MTVTVIRFDPQSEAGKIALSLAEPGNPRACVQAVATDWASKANVRNARFDLDHDHINNSTKSWSDDKGRHTGPMTVDEIETAKKFDKGVKPRKPFDMVFDTNGPGVTSKKVSPGRPTGSKNLPKPSGSTGCRANSKGNSKRAKQLRDLVKAVQEKRISV